MQDAPLSYEQLTTHRKTIRTQNQWQGYLRLPPAERLKVMLSRTGINPNSTNFSFYILSDLMIGFTHEQRLQFLSHSSFLTSKETVVWHIPPLLEGITGEEKSKLIAESKIQPTLFKGKELALILQGVPAECRRQQLSQFTDNDLGMLLRDEPEDFKVWTEGFPDEEWTSLFNGKPALKSFALAIGKKAPEALSNYFKAKGESLYQEIMKKNKIANPTLSPTIVQLHLSILEVALQSKGESERSLSQEERREILLGRDKHFAELLRNLILRSETHYYSTLDAMLEGLTPQEVLNALTPVNGEHPNGGNRLIVEAFENRQQPTVQWLQGKGITLPARFANPRNGAGRAVAGLRP